MKKVALVAEDTEFIREFISNILKGCGYDVIEASDGQEALDLFKENIPRITLLVTDLEMPRINGLDLVILIRRMSQYLPIVMDSGSFSPDNADRARAAGVDEFLSKPFLVQDMVLAIAKAEAKYMSVIR